MPAFFKKMRASRPRSQGFSELACMYSERERKSMTYYVKLAEDDNYVSRLYQDEPIIINDAQKEAFTPPKYRAMRKIAESVGAYHESPEKIFYKQAVFMENFEDDYDYRGEFIQYFPTYQSMSDRQLRGYFSWRTKIRRGIIWKTSLSFVFVYIYELINLIGVNSPEDGFYTLKNFWKTYREIDNRITRYVKPWLKDYVVYYNLDKSLLEEFLDINNDNAILTLLNYESYHEDEVFSALNSLSSYNLEKSRFFKWHSEDVKFVTAVVFMAMTYSYGKKGSKTFCDLFIGKFHTGSYLMFASAVFYDQIQHEDYVYTINELCKYKCKNGKWSSKSFFRYGGKNQQIGALLKTIDSFMRGKYNFQPALKPANVTKSIQRLINNTIETRLATQREAAKPKIEIDVSILQDIRMASLETQNKLLVEEERPAAALGSVPGGQTCGEEPAGEQESGLALSDMEYGLIKGLLYGGNYDDITQSKGLPLSVLADAVNEKLFDRFGDTVIIETDGQLELIADYIEELKEIISE